MGADFGEVTWDEALAEDCRQLVRLAIREDLGRLYDWTTVALVPEAANASAVVRSRRAGVVAGIPAAQLALAEYDPQLVWQSSVTDGDTIEVGTTLATIGGSARNLLTAERTALNLLGRLSGIATLTRAFVDAVVGTRASIYDTRKTEPGYRGLDKYAVRAGGGHNHRRGLYDGILIKDNHLAFGAAGGSYTPPAAIDRCRQVVASLALARKSPSKSKSTRSHNSTRYCRANRISCFWTTCRSPSCPRPSRDATHWPRACCSKHRAGLRWKQSTRSHVRASTGSASEP